MMEDINILDKLGRDTLVEEPLSQFVIKEDTFSKDSEHETDHVRQFKELARTFYLGEVKHDFNQDDPIFMLSSACNIQRTSERCRTCFKICLVKDQIICEFCGQGSCKSCGVKTRYFPFSAIDTITQKHQGRGKCCKLCDRKYLLNEEQKKSLKSLQSIIVAITQAGNTVVQQKNELRVSRNEQNKKLNELKDRIGKQQEDLTSYQKAVKQLNHKINKELKLIEQHNAQYKLTSKFYGE